jgi:hypothetical protein
MPKHPTVEIGGFSGHVCEFEFVPNKRQRAKSTFCFDGVRIAHRGKPGTPQAKTWVSMKPGYEVLDNADLTQLEVRFNRAVQ